MVLNPFARAKEVLRFYRDFSTTIPDAVNTLSALFTTPEGLRVVTIAVCYNGSIEEGGKVLQPLGVPDEPHQ
jgi:hypothetical protein